MKGASTAATWAAAAAVALVLALLLVLLAKLLCSLLWQRRSRSHQSSGTDPRQDPPSPTPSKPLGQSSFPFYAHGVLQAPTSILLSVPKLEAATAPPPPPLNQATESIKQGCSDIDDGSYQFVCISNPIYDGTCGSSDARGGAETTPFETPGTSPSFLGIDGEEEEEDESGCSPPLTVMKKLPQALRRASARACVVDGRSLGTSASATDTTNKASSSCSSNSLCSSPSW